MKDLRGVEFRENWVMVGCPYCGRKNYAFKLESTPCMHCSKKFYLQDLYAKKCEKPPEKTAY